MATMMKAMAVDQLQQLLMAPRPGFVGTPQASSAIAALEDLRETGDPDWLFLRSVLELAVPPSRIPSLSTPQQELLFHCITGCRHVILTRWEAFSPMFRHAVRDVFMEMGTACAAMEAAAGAASTSSLRTIQMAVFTASVAFWKRGWSDDDEVRQVSATSPSEKEKQILSTLQQQWTTGSVMSLNGPDDLFQHLYAAVLSNGAIDRSSWRNMKWSCQYLTALVAEFSTGQSGVTYRLPMEFHQEMHRMFEKEYLEKCLKIAMNALSMVVAAVESDESWNSNNRHFEDIATSVVQTTNEVLNWEFGASSWLHLSARTTLIRPPTSWTHYIVQPEFLVAVFDFHNKCHRQQNLAHHLRQLVLLLCSVSGPVFSDKTQKKLYIQFMCQGAQQLVGRIPALRLDVDCENSSLILDSFSLVGRLLTNFRLQPIADLPCFVPLLVSLRTSGLALMQADLQDYERHFGDTDGFDGEWRQEAIALLWEAIALLCEDPWLCDQQDFAGSAAKVQTKDVLNTLVGPLYAQFIICRGRIEYLNAAHTCREGQNIDTEEEEIRLHQLNEDISVASSLGRLNTSQSLIVMGRPFEESATKLLSSWESDRSDVDPELAGIIHEVDFLIRSIGLLLTTGGSGIPTSITLECETSDVTIELIAGAVRAVFTLIQAQVSRLSSDFSPKRLSPVLANTFLWFLQLWVPVYVHCELRGKKTNKILSFWSATEVANQVVDFCCWMCMQYLYWPDNHIQERSADLMVVLARQSSALRISMKKSGSLQQLFYLHCISTVVTDEVEAANQVKTQGLSNKSFQNFKLLPANVKSSLLRALLTNLGDEDCATIPLFNDCLRAVSGYISVLLCVPDALSKTSMIEWIALLHGIVRAIPDVSEKSCLTAFISQYLEPLADSMNLFAKDLAVCEHLLDLFCDYGGMISKVKPDDNQVLAFLKATSVMLGAYSHHHCFQRTIHAPSDHRKVEEQEENKYRDIDTALTLLRHVLDMRNQHASQVSLFGLQQLLPLMTQGLLKYSSLSSNYFSLVIAMVDQSSEIISTLPFDLLDSLLQSLALGVAHEDAKVATKSLTSLEGLYKAHLRSGLFQQQLHEHPDLFGTTSKATIQLVYQATFFDRLEATSAAVLSLIALDVSGFVATSEKTAQQSKSYQPLRFRKAIEEQLLRREFIDKVLDSGFEGRQNRKEFCSALKGFANDVQSFLVLQ